MVSQLAPTIKCAFADALAFSGVRDKKNSELFFNSCYRSVDFDAAQIDTLENRNSEVPPEGVLSDNERWDDSD